MQENNQRVEERERRRLLVFKAGPRLLGVFADEANTVVEWRRPTPLPYAPKSVLGVVSVRGRMLTVLDPLSLLSETNAVEALSFNFIIPLGGDEQLALAAEQAQGFIEIFADEISPQSQDLKNDAVLGIIESESGPLVVLKVRELFAAALQGAERRRKRF
jgi:purine-binding chemotaxis protein CheW